MEKRKPKVAWSHWDRILIGAIGLVVALSGVVALWFHQLDIDPHVAIPTPTLPKHNAYDYFVAAGNALIDHEKIDYAVAHLPIPPPAPPPRNFSPSSGPGAVRPGSPRRTPDHFYSLAQKAALVKENEQTLKLLREGLAYPYQEPPVRSFSTLLPHLVQARNIAGLLSLKAEVEAGRGDWNAAINSNLDAIQMGQELPHGGPLMGALAGSSCQSLGQHHAWDCIAHLNAEEAQAAAWRLEAIDARHFSWADTVQEQKWVDQAGLMECMTRADWPMSYRKVVWSDDGSDMSGRQRLDLLQIRLSGKRAIMSNCTRYMDQCIANARQPYAAHPQRPNRAIDPISHDSDENFDGERITDATCQTQNNLLLVALALRAYRLNHGTYPATLAALAPKYLKAVPDDPFALSGPLRYKRVGQKYVLYSIGPDGKDDGGKAVFVAAKPAPLVVGARDPRYSVEETSVGDIVAGVNPQDAVDSPALRQRVKQQAAQEAKLLKQASTMPRR